MLKAVILMRRRPEVSHDEFTMQFRVNLRPLIDALPGVSRIVVSDAIAGPGGRPTYDGMAELFFDDITAVRHLVDSTQARELQASMASFVDMDSYETFLAVEREHEHEHERADEQRHPA